MWSKEKKKRNLTDILTFLVTSLLPGVISNCATQMTNMPVSTAAQALFIVFSQSQAEKLDTKRQLSPFYHNLLMILIDCIN